MSDQDRQKLSIDGVDVFVDELTEEQRGLVVTIQHLDKQLSGLRDKLAAEQVARQAVFEALKRSVSSEEPPKKRGFFF